MTMIGKCRAAAVPALAALASLIMTSCSPSPAAPSTAGPRSPAKAGRAAASRPLPTSTVKMLPAHGVIYFLAGTSLPGYNLWQASAAGLKQLTFNPTLGFSAFAASNAGIVLADDKFQADLLTILTPSGPAFLRSGGASGSVIHGSAPAISDTGSISYVTPPSGNGSLFRIWTRRTAVSRSSMIYQSTHELSGPVTGPNGQLAIVQGADMKAGLVIIPPGGKPTPSKSCLNSVVQLVWGAAAAALAESSLSKHLCLIYPDGTIRRLPTGWYPLAWSPDGHQLLVQAGRLLRLWSASNPSATRVIGTINPGFNIRQASWLQQPASRRANQ